MAEDVECKEVARCERPVQTEEKDLSPWQFAFRSVSPFPVKSILNNRMAFNGEKKKNKFPTTFKAFPALGKRIFGSSRRSINGVYVRFKRITFYIISKDEGWEM